MKLASERTKKAMEGVLFENPSPENYPDPVYSVFSDLEGHEWANITVVANGPENFECPKTYGHYHPENAPDETYMLVQGEGYFLLQSKFKENGSIIWKKVGEVLIVKLEKNEKIVISSKWGHSWSNIGNAPLVTVDNWKSGHTPQDYEPITKQHGMAYYLINKGGQIVHIANKNYLNLPEPKYLTAEEFAKYEKENL